jgi:simple sugar transport system permease protein
MLAMVSSSGFQVGQTGGRGYIGLAAMIFGNWRPVGMFLGSLLFGYTEALPLREGTVTLHGLLLLVAVVLFAFAVLQLLRGARSAGLASLVFAGLFLAWYLTTDEVAREFTTMAPYVMTLLVLAFASQRLRMPAADGRVYRKGSAG